MHADLVHACMFTLKYGSTSKNYIFCSEASCSYLLRVKVEMVEQQGNDEVEQNLVKESCSWKRKLSAALNDEQIFFSLLLISVFYVGYTAAKAHFDANDTSIGDDERFIQSCYCSLDQRRIYRFWYISFCAIWWVIHTYTFFAQVLAKKYEGCGNIITGLLAICSVLLERICSIFCCLCPCRKGDDGPNVHQNCLAIQGLVSKEKLESNITLLWFQYCKLYVVGYAKDDEKISIVINPEDNNKDRVIKYEEDCFLECIHSKEVKVSCLCCIKCNCAYNKENQEGIVDKSCFICCFQCKKQSHKKKSNNLNDDCVCCNKSITCPNINMMCCDYYFPSTHILKGVIRGFLLLIKYVSQLVTVPLLLLQIFDTYSLLCFSPDLYCSSTSEYKLHLAQTAITLLFYCSLTLSQLTSTMLEWNPWPKDKNASLQ